MTYSTLGACPHSCRNGGQRRVHAIQVIDEAARVAHQQLSTPPAHGTVILMDVGLQTRNARLVPQIPSPNRVKPFKAGQKARVDDLLL